MTIKTLITACLLSLLLSPISNAGIAEKAYTFERWVVNTKINADTSTVETEELSISVEKYPPNSVE